VAGIKPEPVTDVQVNNLSGASVLSYTLSGNGVMYVIAEYEIRPGFPREVKSSMYKRELRLDGFHEAGDYEVKLYAVGRSEERSEPVVVTVSPSEPPYWHAYHTLTVAEDFGGLTINFDNPENGDLVVEVITPDSTDASKWMVANRLYTNSQNGRLSVRGFQPEERLFGIHVRDRWNNKSDTLFTSLTPLYESFLDKGRFEEVRLPTDGWVPHVWAGTWPKAIPQLWDGNTAGPGGEWSFFSANGTILPHHFTFYLGGTFKLSRFRMWMPTTGGNEYAGARTKRFELWGTTAPDFATGSFDNWVLLGTFENIKPSGSPYGQVTPEDLAVAHAGHEHTFSAEDDIPPVSYLRVRTLETFLPNAGNVLIAEMSFWGAEILEN